MNKKTLKYLFVLLTMLVISVMSVNAVCVNPTVGMDITTTTTFCSGTYQATNITISGNNIVVSFNNTKINYNSTWFPSGSNLRRSMFLITGSNVTLDCSNYGEINGYYSDPDNSGTFAVDVKADNFTMNSCNISTHHTGVVTNNVGLKNNLYLNNLNLNNIYADAIYGGGHNAKIIDVVTDGRQVTLFGSNQYVEGYVGNQIFLGDANDVSKNWTGTVKDSFKTGGYFGVIHIGNIGYPYNLNITGNGVPDTDSAMWGLDIGNYVPILGDFTASNQYVYNNHLFRIWDTLNYTIGEGFDYCPDYPNGNYNVYRYPPEGFVERTQPNYQGGHPNNGTCCWEQWSPQYTSCTIGDNQTLYYTDSASCGTTFETPVDNGTISTCNYCTASYHFENATCIDFKLTQAVVYDNYDTCCNVTGIAEDCAFPSDNVSTVSCVGIHETSDITGLVIDTGVEIGRNYIYFVPLIVLIILGIYILTKVK